MPGPKAKPPLQEIGKKYGRLTVQSEFEQRYVGRRRLSTWHCLCACDCGAQGLWVSIRNLHSGMAQSCGCLQRERTGNARRTHGGSRSRLYNIWILLRDRCKNPKNSHWQYYGGKGVRVCEKWEQSFAAFQKWAQANGYREDLQIDRRDNDGDYEPANCRWVDSKTNRNNRPDKRMLTAFGETKNVTDWAKDARCQTNRTTLGRRAREGWNHETAILTPSPYGRQRRDAQSKQKRRETLRKKGGVAAFGEVKLLPEWAEDERCVVAYHTLRKRIQVGWDPERAITETTT